MKIGKRRDYNEFYIKNKIELLNCQIDLILRSLGFYAYNYSLIYQRIGKSESLEENLRKSLVRDTYHQITSQIHSNYKTKSCDTYNEIKKFFIEIA